MRIKVLFWVLFGIALMHYLVIVLWSLPRIAAEAGGQVPFDMRPTGYTFEEARGFLAALTPTGRDYYLGVQHGLDWVYPGLLAMTLGLGFVVLTRGPLRWALVVLAAAVAVFDWMENRAVAGMLLADPQAVTASLVESASRWSLLKSLATTAAGLALLAAAIVALVRRRSGPASLKEPR